MFPVNTNIVLLPRIQKLNLQKKMKAEPVKSGDEEQKKKGMLPSAAVSGSCNWKNIHVQCERISSEDIDQCCHCAHMEQHIQPLHHLPSICKL